MKKENNQVITLTFDDGSTKELDILFTYNLESNGKNYVFVYDEDLDQISVLEYLEKGDGEGEVLPVNPEDEGLWAELEEVLNDYYDAQEAGACEGCPGANSGECDGCDK